MLKVVLLCILFVAIATTALQIHDYGHHEQEYEHSEHSYEPKYEAEPEAEETEHHHEVEHKHATSHQSVKFHHFHAVPVYIKKEDQHLIKKPIDIGSTKQKLKVLHPETKHNHEHGLVLENESDTHLHSYGHYEEPYHHQEHYEHHEHHGHE